MIEHKTLASYGLPLFKWHLQVQKGALSWKFKFSMWNVNQIVKKNITNAVSFPEKYLTPWGTNLEGI